LPGLEGPEGPKGIEGSGGLKGERGLPGDPGRCRPRRSSTFLQDDPHANLPINAAMFSGNLYEIGKEKDPALADMYLEAVYMQRKLEYLLASTVAGLQSSGVEANNHSPDM